MIVLRLMCWRMKQLITNESNKLFYGKYLYRLEINNHLARFFREKNLPQAKSVLDSLQGQIDAGMSEKLTVRRGLRHIQVPYDEFIDAVRLYSSFITADDYKLRVSYSFLNIYANNLDWLKDIANQINSNKVYGLWKPNEKYITSLKEKNIILVKESNGYQYKVTFGNGRGEESFIKWADANPNLIKVGPRLKEELEAQGYVNGMYFYARDEKTLSLCNLVTSNIRRIDKLLVKSDLDK